MAVLDELVTQIENPDLRARIAAEVEKLAKQKKFGLVFEEHLPECTPLWDIPIKTGSKVALKAGQVNDFYTVLKIEDGVATCLNKDKSETKEFTVNELVAVAEFGEPIYPYLKPIDTVCNAPDSDLWHTLIEADNYHALQLLEYLYAGKVDCIYIDPPYNSGATDWKYNNNYVDSNDQYRHSKWLSMMQKRLKLAKKLLNPRDSVLIVTIDEKEYLHLGCLLEEIFPEAYIQMVTIVINPKGSTRGRFSRVEEYAFFCFMPEAYVSGGTDPMLGEIGNTEEDLQPRWKGLLRSGIGSRREDSPNLFYPILVDKARNIIIRAEKSIPLGIQPNYEEKIDGYDVAWPIRSDGTAGRWMLSSETFNAMLSKGYISLGRFDNTRKTWGLSYLSKKYQEQIKSGELKIVGRTENGQSVVVEFITQQDRQVKTVWHRTRHDAGAYGSDFVSTVIGRTRAFSYPKSLYAEVDAISTVVRNKPNALIVDFFAGSGTTLHAVNLLNAEDGGHRRCILVTNNEVSTEEAAALSKQGFQPGDQEWDKLGIARYVTWPRVVCSIKGKDINGHPLAGTYGVYVDQFVADADSRGKYVKKKIPAYPYMENMKISDGFKTNAAFFKLGFLDKNTVALGKQFKEMLPTLWMKAGAHGHCPDFGEQTPDMLILPENKFAVLVDEKRYMEFVEKLDGHSEIETVFIVTDSESGYKDMIAGLNVKEGYQLYRDYLDNFRINSLRR